MPRETYPSSDSGPNPSCCIGCVIQLRMLHNYCNIRSPLSEFSGSAPGREVMTAYSRAYTNSTSIKGEGKNKTVESQMKEMENELRTTCNVADNA